MTKEEVLARINRSVDLIPIGRPNRSQRVITPTSITIHNTSNTNKGADAAAHARFVSRTGHYKLPSGKLNWVSWHYSVDDGQVIQHLPTHERAIHAGNGNASSLGIEICMHAGIDQAAANQRSAHLTAALLHDLGLGIAAIRTHKSWTGKDCPTLLLAGFDAFKLQCGAILTQISAVPRPILVTTAGAGPVMKQLLPALDPEIEFGEIDHGALDLELAQD